MVCLICIPEARGPQTQGLRVYISDKPLIPTLQLQHTSGVCRTCEGKFFVINSVIRGFQVYVVWSSSYIGFLSLYILMESQMWFYTAIILWNIWTIIMHVKFDDFSKKTWPHLPKGSYKHTISRLIFCHHSIAISISLVPVLSTGTKNNNFSTINLYFSF